MMKILMFIMALLMTPNIFANQISVLVTMPPQSDGLVTTEEAKYRKDISDSMKDVMKKINKSKMFKLVTESSTDSDIAEADITLVIVTREWASTGAFRVVYEPLGYVRTQDEKNRFIGVSVVVNGDQVTTLHNRAGVMSWGQAASQVVKELEEFVEVNATYFSSI